MRYNLAELAFFAFGSEILTNNGAAANRGGKIPELDFLRAVACLCVILIHVTANPLYYATPGTPEYLLLLIANQFTRFAVPAFVFISGFALANAYGAGRSSFDYFAYLKRRLGAVLPLYVLWSAGYHAYLHLPGETHSWSQHFMELGKSLLLGTAAYHLYFIVLICQFYLLAPVFLKLAGWLSSPRRLVGTGFVWQLAATAYNYYIAPAHIAALSGMPLLAGAASYLDRNFLLWMGYFIVGMGVALELPAFRSQVARWGVKTAIPFLLGWAALVGEFVFAIKMGRSFAGTITSIKPLVLLYTAAAVPFLFWVEPRICWQPAKKFFKRVAERSFEIYLIHPAVIWMLQSTSWFRKLEAVFAAVPLTAMVYLACVAITYGIAVLGYSFLAKARRRAARLGAEAVSIRK